MWRCQLLDMLALVAYLNCFGTSVVSVWQGLLFFYVLRTIQGLLGARKGLKQLLTFPDRTADNVLQPESVHALLCEVPTFRTLCNLLVTLSEQSGIAAIGWNGATGEAVNRLHSVRLTVNLFSSSTVHIYFRPWGLRTRLTF